MSTTEPAKVSWGAATAGLAVVLGLQLVLGVLGLSVGAASLEPGPAGLGVGTGLWFALTTAVALFAGGWVAGRLAGTQRRVETVLHGVLAWSLATLATAYFLTTAVGGAIGGTTGILGRELAVWSAWGTGSGAGGERLGVGVEDVRREAEALLRVVGASEGRDGVGELLDRLLAGDAADEDAFTTKDEAALARLLLARAGMTQAEARTVVRRWRSQVADAYARERVAESEAARARATDAALAGSIARAAGWSVAIMLLGLAAAALGGLVAAPRGRGRTLTATR